MPDGDLQRHFTSLLQDAELRARYRRDLDDARAALDPAVTVPALAAKYAQIRDVLRRVPALPRAHDTMDWYDEVYQVEAPTWLRARYDFLDRLP